MTSSTNTSTPLNGLSAADRTALLERLKAEKGRRVAENRLRDYKPYPKQMEFHSRSATTRERLFMAGNQLGKTLSGAAEMAMHLTGRYPDWWTGRRFEKPIVAIAGSESTELTRDGVQRLVVGTPSDEKAWGTGMVPKEALVTWNRKQGVANALDSILVKHSSGGTSTLLFKSYDQGRTKWQANTVDVVWFDEEPPEDVYSEGLTRTNATNGIVYLTFTPLLGMSKVVMRFLNERSEYRAVVTMTIEDALHYTPEERKRIVDAYPEHERDARAKGIPILGSGRIYPVAESAICCRPIPIPDYWPRIAGIDFGWDHPTAAVEIVWNRDADTVYVIREHRLSKSTATQHAAALRQWGEGLPFAWPHDGLQHDKASGEQLARQYKKAGLKMLGDRATFPDGTSGVEAGINELLQRMQSGRFKVFEALCPQWLEEFRMYHREDGKVVKEYDDLLDATRYAVMMLRYARLPSSSRGGNSATVSRIAAGVGEIEGW